MTYRLQMAGERRRQEREHRDRMHMAWHIAALSRQDRLQTLSSVTGHQPQVRKQTPSEVKALFRAMREGRS